jgi:hypothetical protein
MINLLMALWTAAAQTTIVVEEHANIEVYVNTPKIVNYSSETEGHISSKSVYTNNAKYWKSGKVINERGTYDKLGTHSNVKIYDKDTIEYAYKNCNYLLNAKECANQNNHLLVETLITIDDHETVVQMMLFNPDMTLLSTSTVSDRGEINYIKQQETRITMTRGRIDMRVMPEQEPLKWIIPAHLLEGYVRQAAHGLWLGVKIQ